MLTTPTEAGPPNLPRQPCSNCNDKGFWKRFKCARGSLPLPLASHPPWHRFHAKLCASPAARAWAHAPPPPPAASAASGLRLAAHQLNEPVTQAEVQQALPSLDNAKAGWPAELLRYATHHVEDDNGKPVKAGCWPPFWLKC